MPTAMEELNDSERGELWAALALRNVQGLGLRSHKKLLDFFGSAFEAMRNINDWSEAGIAENKIAAARSEAWRKDALPEWQAARKLDGLIILWTSPDYPALLKQLPDPPLFLYGRGDRSLLKNPAIAVVGARECTLEGIKSGSEIAGNLAESGITIISGMAFGIDRQAHSAALKQPGSSIAVLGCGIDIIYPAKNTDLYYNLLKNGLILSEYAPGSRPEARNFPIRNRIISGLSLGVLVVEAAMRSGSLITARMALEQNREVYAIPGPTSAPTSQGCRELIRNGARPVFSAEDIMRDLAVHLQDYKLISAASETEEKKTARKLPHSEDPDGMRVIELLSQKGPRNSDQLGAELDLPAAHVNSLLVRMEIEGIIARLPGMRFDLS